MNYEQILANAASLSISFGVFSIILLKKNMLGNKLATVLVLLGIVFKGLGLQYEYSFGDVMVIAMGAVLLFMNGLVIGREKGRKEKRDEE